MASRRKPAGVRVDATVHTGAHRTNIPTAELEAFAEEQERKPMTLLYPRDPSLDPQLVWRGKDNQDRSNLTVPVVPIYIQEKISPQALIEDLRSEQKRSAAEQQIDLFRAFNGLEFEQLVNFYKHSQQWTNRMVLGDSLLVMASLAEKEGLKGKVQMIYVDPPYGIKFNSNWQVSTRKRQVRDGRAEDATRQPEQVKAFRDTWELRIHSYLTYLRDRLQVAHDLLSEAGSIFVQIGDENQHLVRSVLDEVFGSENFVSAITLAKTAGASSELLAGISDYLLWYARDRQSIKYRPLFRDKTSFDDGGGEYRFLLLPDGSTRSMTAEERADASQIPDGSVRFRPSATTSQKPPGSDPFNYKGRQFTPGPAQFWKTSLEGLRRLGIAGRLIPRGDSISYLRRLDDFPVTPLNNIWLDVRWGFDASDKTYVVETNSKIIERCVLMTTDPGDLVLDPTCGSGTTAFVAEQWGRRWITIDTSRVALALARTRLMSGRFPYYLLADSEAGANKQAELHGRLPQTGVFSGDISKGFIYEQVAHITLKAIANNPDIHEGMTREEINAAIARHGESELLYDRPYVDPKTVRVTGPFTVESLSPHRVLPADAALNRRASVGEDAGRFLERIIDYLRKAGIQNTVKQERLTFDRLDPWPGGVYVQAVGEYKESEKSRTVALCIGPEYGTVGPELVREAAKEAVKIADLLVVCGFAFEPLVGEEASHIGRLTIVKAKMNPDLSMGDELLKKTGAANLFMVFGEPDITIAPAEDAKITIEIHGLDVYDPTTGAIRSHSTDDIACWFIDTDYNGESFFVRHAYFLGADDPYDKLKRVLRAEIDEVTWSTMYATKSRPFPKPNTGKIAVKVINHYGDEVLKVFSV